ncbi:hypothetical protein [Vibrio parahaemolyticus]|uniref:hypothetical protein n=1 Tax=Vibrio parahaemolyticus TaxID=670 RepID=UPI001781C3AA|nr:hypothetical protein [Vibrio parahaemolyticus]MBD6947926.1 hypothetical protein [Vibrio parahaemolyticus]MBD6959656.1 hypothetical protein [Vibrio parahaemolyticus]MBD6977545.1 hypothetical protein [Vibrio parahaemolyticus]MBD6990476.1 hypothetical protein [Vibrio parahaemolyticus]WOZ60677.1 hypothetical protein RHS38_07465 [Vibrio parahaemolyticus]
MTTRKHTVVRVQRDLINPSVEDAKAYLEELFAHDVALAKSAAELALDRLPVGRMCGHLGRIAMLRTIIKRADKLLATSK